MESTEIKNNEVIETTEEIIETGMSKSMKVAFGIGIGAVVGFAAYKCVVKPLMARIKAGTEQKKMTIEPETEPIVVESCVSEEAEN